MSFLWLILPILFFAFLACWIKAFTTHKKKQILERQLDGLYLGTHLKNLLANVQQHRGMLNAFLKGDASFKFKILAIQKEIERELGTLITITVNQENYQKRIGALNQDWKNLSSDALQLQLEFSFSEHCTLIDKILALLTDVAEQNQLINEHSYAIEYVDIIWRLLPITAESLGKARAVGSGIAAAGSATAVDQVNMKFLIHKIETTVQQVKKNLAQVQDSNNTLPAIFSQIDTQLQEFLSSIEAQLLLPEKTSIQASHFFNSTTQLLDAVYGLYEQGENMAKNSINRAIFKLENTLKFAYSGIFVSGILMSSLYYWSPSL